MSRLKELYKSKIKNELAKEFDIKNVNAIPQIKKVVVNAGVGRATQDSKYLVEAEEALVSITGQKAVKNVAKKSIAGFKIREGNAIGVSVTLRNEMAYEFIDRLVNATLPRIRDFRGIKRTAFDGNGNYSIGIKEHTVFPEMIGKEVNPISLQVNIETSAKNNEEALALLRAMGFPFKAEE
ncbi:MAG: 50S ribosomal protein L5 [Patescibacteria group bacterium]|nr:50S ribosomal protein L5 [Patescibacteria group bacterium]